MKVLQINTVSGYGSTGRTCVELAFAIEKEGHEAYIAYGQGVTDYRKSFKVGATLENHIHNLKSRLIGKQGYSSSDGTKKLINYIRKIKPDIIHLRNLHGNYLNLRLLFNYLSSSGIPVVWSLHDCWAFTGKCAHYSEAKCYKWQIQCNRCPQINEYPPSLFFDKSKQMFEDKKKWFTSIKNLTIVPVSYWLADEIRKSFLAKYPIQPIYNWIDQTVFKPTASDLKTKYGIEKNKFIVLGVSAGWKENKSKLKDFISLSKLLSEDIQIVLVGNIKDNSSIPSNILHLPYIEGTNKLAEIYSMADVYVHTSLEDTFGKVIAEAMSCGTPVVVYNSTACPELVKKGCGYIVEKRNVKGIYNALQKIKYKGKMSYSENCIQKVQNNFNYGINAHKTIRLYERILEK